MTLVLQQWTGWVDTYVAGEETFLARLNPVVGEGPEVWAAIYVDALPPERRHLLADGAYLHWAITDDRQSDLFIAGSLAEVQALAVAGGLTPYPSRGELVNVPETAPARLAGSPTGVIVLAAHAQRAFASILPPETPVEFTVVAGSDLYGFASADSDYDLRGVYTLPARAFLGLDKPTLEVRGTETLDPAWGTQPLDVVYRELGAYLALLVGKRDVNSLEWLAATPLRPPGDAWVALRERRRDLITRNHHHAYAGFALGEWRRVLELYRPPAEVWDRTRYRLKPLLYTFRLLLAGIFLQEEGEIEPRLPILIEHYRLGWLRDVLKAKTAAGEVATLDELPEAYSFYQHHYRELYRRLSEPGGGVHERWPEKVTPETYRDLSDLLIDARTNA